MDYNISLITGIVLLASATLAWLAFFWCKLAHSKIAVDFIGEIGTIGKGGIPKNSFGKVLLSGRLYSAIIARGSIKDEIPEGENVEVVSFDGKFFTVKPL